MKITSTLPSLLIFLFLHQVVLAQDYQTVRSGNWDKADTWAGGNIPPTGSQNKIIQINAGHDVNFTGNYNYGLNTTTIVKGSLTINAWNFSLGNYSKLIVEGTFYNNQVFIMGNNAEIRVSGQLINKGNRFEIGHGAHISVEGSLTNTSSMVYGDNSTANISGQVNNSGSTFAFGKTLFLSVFSGGRLTTSGRFTSGKDGYYLIEGIFFITGYEFRVGSNTAIWVSGNLSASHNWSFFPDTNTIIYNCNDSNLANFRDPNVQFLDCVLPIELLSFTAQYHNKKVLINWSTGSEINNDYFTIERSSNTMDAEVIDYFDGAGNSSNTLYYHYIDQSPLQGITYYRLKQTDFDGSFEYSHWVAVEAEDQTRQITATVISRSEGLMMRVIAPTELPIHLEIIDLHGRVVHTQELSPASTGQVQTFIPLPQNGSSVLLYRITHGLEVVTGKLIR